MATRGIFARWIADRYVPCIQHGRYNPSQIGGFDKGSRSCYGDCCVEHRRTPFGRPSSPASLRSAGRRVAPFGRAPAPGSLRSPGVPMCYFRVTQVLRWSDTFTPARRCDKLARGMTERPSATRKRRNRLWGVATVRGRCSHRGSRALANPVTESGRVTAPSVDGGNTSDSGEEDAPSNLGDFVTVQTDRRHQLDHRTRKP